MGTACYPIQADPAGETAWKQRLKSDDIGLRKSQSRKNGKPAERRSDQRYELQLELDLFQLRGVKQLVWIAAGKTVNWSRNSVLVYCDRQPASGSSVQLAVRWTSGVQLVVVGRVVRTEDRGVVIKILRRRFRGKPALPVNQPGASQQFSASIRHGGACRPAMRAI